MFDEGRLAEMGTHQELLQIKDGKYAHLFRLQSEGYAEFNNEKNQSSSSGQVPKSECLNLPVLHEGT